MEEEGSTLTPTTSHGGGRGGRRASTTCLSSEQPVEEPSLWRWVGSVHIQIRTQQALGLIDVDLLKTLHLNHLERVLTPYKTLNHLEY